jgi:amino acid adenylation domain-containing protein
MNILPLFARLETLGINLKLVDGRLKIDAPKGKLTPGLIDEIKDKKPGIIEFLQKHAQKREKYASIEVVENKQYYPLSSAQQRLYFIQQMDPESTAYNMPAVRELIGPLDKEKLSRAFCRLISRHESLRTSFQVVKEEPVQVIRKDVEFEIENDRSLVNGHWSLVNCQGRGEVSSPIKIETIIQEFVRPFDLSSAPLLRVGLVELEKHRHVLMVDMHHIISDGKSLEIFIKEFIGLYEEKELSGLRIQYKDYTQWQKSYPQQTLLNQQKEYWLEELQGELPLLNLPKDYPRPVIRKFDGAGLEFKISSQATAALKEMAIKSGATLYMVLLAVYTILLAKICNQEDIIVGTPAAGRKHAELGNIIGMFVNTLALRNFPAAEKTFSRFLAEVKDRSLAAFAHQDYIYEDLVEAVAVERDTSRNPLFDTLFALQNLDIPDIKIPGLKVKPLTYEIGTAKFDLSLDAFETKDTLHFVFGYGTRLFRENTLQRFVTYFKRIITAVVENSRIKLSRIDILPQDEKKQVLMDFNDTVTPYPGDKTIHELFEEQAERTPHQIALLGPRDQKGSELVSITYRQLNEESGRLAHLLQERGVKPGTIAGMMVQRSVEMVMSILGILKAGAAYMPIDPDYPGERINYMLADSKVQFLLTDNPSRHFNCQLSIVNCQLSMNKRTQPSTLTSTCQVIPANLAYIIYTSGSTGRARGVMIEHRSVLGRIIDANFIAARAGSRLLLTGSIVFDITTFEIWWPLLNGLQLVIVDQDQVLDAHTLKQVITKNKITVMHLIPQLLNRLAHEDIRIFAGLDYFLVGGDLVKPRYVNLLRNKYPDLKILHMYGPTENTTFSTFLPVDRDYTASIPIGKPVSNCYIYIMDNYLHLQPVRTAGELYVGGVGVARGYLNNPELTREKFIFYRSYRSYMTYIPKKLYKTGDIGWWQPDGNIGFLGRVDHQVKIRGMRVELGEIECLLLAHEGVKDAVLVDRKYPDGDKYLCAYITPAGEMEQAPNSADLQAYLGQKLPNYMVPSFYMFLNRLPLTPNGKIDKKALPEPDRRTDTGSAQTYAAPRTRLEEKLAGLWSAVLGIEKESISIQADFFRLGGHSLKATTLIARIHKELGVKIPLSEVFKNPTIEGLALYMKNRSKEKRLPLEASEKREYYPLSSAQSRFYILQRVTPGSTAYNLASIIQVEGHIEKEKIETALRKLIRQHESLRTSFLEIDNQPAQRIHDDVEFKIDYDRSLANCQGRGEVPSPIKVEKIIENIIRPFDLSRVPLLRLGLIKWAEEKHILMFDMHHIISDGTSLTIFFREFMTFYSRGTLPLLRLQYKDFVLWQHRQLTSGGFKKYEEYWLKQFPGDLPVLDMPMDFPRPVVQGFEGDKFTFNLGESLTRALDGLIKETGVTLYMVLLAVYNILLARYTGQEDIVIGLTIAGRAHPDMESIIGLLLETLVQRNYPLGHLEFGEFLESVKQDTLNAYENQDYPFRQLIRKLGADNEISRNPVFDAMLIVQNFEKTGFELAGLRFLPYQPAGKESRPMSKVDFTIEAMEIGEEIHFTLEYCTRLYKRETMEQLARHFIHIIKEVVKNPAIRLANIQVISQEEKKQLLEEFNTSPREIPGKNLKTVIERFQEQAEKTPDNIAVTGPYKGTGGLAPLSFLMSISYRALQEKSHRLACWLQDKGVGFDTIAGIMVEPSMEMAIGLLGILKSGSAYLPIDPEYPQERIDYMLKDSGAEILLKANDFTPPAFNNRPQGTSIPPSTLLPFYPSHSSNLAYIIYTSGTTGRPKGVLVEHRNLTTYIQAFEKEFNLREDDVVLQQVSYAFDAFVEELYPILLKGGRLAIPPRQVIKDIHAICDFINRHQVTFITCSPQLLGELDKFPHRLTSLRILISGGDRLKAEYIRNLMGVGEVYNTYGPTESTVCATYYRCDKDQELPSNIPIGKPITHYQVYILDKYHNLLPVGVSGELCVAGAGVTRGYLNNPGLTNKKFSLNLSYMSYLSHIYRTGDLARWLQDGNIEFLGRIDRQVKIRGYRIELGEIENQLLALKEIKKAVVIERERKSGQNYLTAYVAAETNGNQNQILDTAGIKQRLAQQLPGYMIPSYIVAIDEIPLTVPGKVDSKRLLLVDSRDVHPDRPFTAPQSKNEKIVVKVWKEVLEVDTIGLDDNFFDLGGTSLDIFKVSSQINRLFNKQIPVVALFQHSTARSLARYLEEGTGQESISPEKQEALSRALDRGKNRLKRQVKEKQETLEIAVIGMVGIFPGAGNIHEFWENLKNGVESITFFTDDELKSDGVDEQLLANPDYIKARGIIAGVEYFDSSFFGFAPVEAQIMDPQMRIFLHCVWHALEDAGYEPFSYDRCIGLYAGASPNLNWEALTSFTSLNQGMSGFMVAQLADKDFMCTHISYKLNLKGPAVSIQTACSTSLVAIHWAVQGLLNGECEMALAGGVSITYPPKRGYIYQEGMIFSNDAHNRTFDAEARGSIFGDGVGAVVLKPLADAAANGDHIYAIIRGTAINNDGYRKVGYTAPSVEGQAEVIKAAQLMAEVKPESITYIEAHGTATPLGDTVEIEALKQAFNTNKKNYCAIGTVKSNLGHLYSAAGVTGFIKTVLALNHRLIPPSLHFNTPNPEIDFENSPFYVNTGLKEWKSNNGNPLRAGVSSFGIGGTNAHIILEEAPTAQSVQHKTQTADMRSEGTRGLAPLSTAPLSEEHPSRKYQLILLSAKTPTALDKITENLAEYLKNNLLNPGNHENPTNPGPILADMAYTLQVGRKHFPYRRMLVSSTRDVDLDQFGLYMKRVPTALAREENRPIVFMFCGQGSQYVNMGIDLYRTEPIFREEMDRCSEILNTLVDYDLKEILYPSERSDQSDRSDYSDLINQTEITQPLVFAFEYALAKLLICWGIKPWAMIGYSFGEYIAACISGVFSLEDALKLVITRGRLTQQTPAGAMISVPLPEEELKPLLNKDLSLAIVNGPTCIVSGASEAVAAFEKEMKKKRIISVPLNMSQAIHSRLMESIRQEFQQNISRFRLNPPQIPYISNVTARWITGEEAVNPRYWGDHLCTTVRFSHGLKELLKQDNAIFIEIGAGRILGMMVRTHPDKKPGHMVLNTVKHQQEKIADDYFLLEKVGQLWLHGQRIDWKAFYGKEKRYRVSMPGYPFEGKRYWLDPNINPFQIGSSGQTQLLSRESKPEPGGGAAPGPFVGLDSREIGDETHKPPRNELEQKIARMWQEYMGVEKVSIHDDFFYLNGNSLIATQLMARLKQEYQVEIPANRFYENPTIAHLAEIINELLEKK